MKNRNICISALESKIRKCHASLSSSPSPVGGAVWQDWVKSTKGVARADNVWIPEIIVVVDNFLLVFSSIFKHCSQGRQCLNTLKMKHLYFSASTAPFSYSNSYCLHCELHNYNHPPTSPQPWLSPPKLDAAHFEHFSEHCVSAQLAGQRQAGQTSVIPEQVDVIF